VVALWFAGAIGVELMAFVMGGRASDEIAFSAVYSDGRVIVSK